MGLVRAVIAAALLVVCVRPSAVAVAGEPASASVVGYGQQAAYWVDEDSLAVPSWLLPQQQADPGTLTWELITSPDAGAGLEDGAVSGGDARPLTYDADGLPSGVLSAHPELKGYLALTTTGLGRSEVAQLLRGQVLVAQYTSGRLTALTGVQTAIVLDAFYADAAGHAALGAVWAGNTPSLGVWAPTARDVTLLLYTGGAGEPERRPMTRRDDGTWTISGAAGWKGAEYLYEVTVYAPSTGKIEVNRVTDPYSVALSVDSRRSVLVDLADRRYRPASWVSTPAPKVASDADRSMYELGVRDFSIGDDTVPAGLRGTYKAFTLDSAGRTHLRKLRAAGLNTVHLLPTADFTGVPEDRAQQAEPDCDLASFAPDSTEQQACVGRTAGRDGFDWGYNTLHFMAPEGSLAAEPDGGRRVAEFREMVGGLHADKLQVVLDVVFNHTPEAGQRDGSILDRIVPGYYQRLDAAGNVYNSSCCSNTATEHAMMEKLMVDSVVLWAKQYKVDGFRFDVMNLQPKAGMLAVRAALDKLTLGKDGVDGASIYLYGEGWNFGETADNALFVSAARGELSRTGIGAFAASSSTGTRGGTPWTGAGTAFEQGFGTGLFLEPNGHKSPATPEEERALLDYYTQLVQFGLVGSLSSFKLTTPDGTVKRGSELFFNGAALGFADQPAEAVVYPDLHDFETLYDAMAIKLPLDTPMRDRLRMHYLILATTALSQSPSQWNAGTDILHSKSLDANSYNSGDWFNAIDWTGRTSNFGAGMPGMAVGNPALEQAYAEILADADIKPTAADSQRAGEGAMELLRLKHSTRLFSLGDATLINQKLTFPSSGPDAKPGVIVMSIDDTRGRDVDPSLNGALVVFNSSPEAVTQTIPELAGRHFALSPIQRHGVDPVVKRTTWSAESGTVTVPPRSAVVLIEAQR